MLGGRKGAEVSGVWLEFKEAGEEVGVRGDVEVDTKGRDEA